MNIVSVKINCYKGFSYLETLDGIKNAGIRYVELSSSSGNSLGLKQNASIDELKRLKDDLDKRKIEVISVGGNSFLMDDDTSKIISNIDIAKYFNAKYIITTVFNPRNDADSFASDEEVIEHIEYYIPYLEKNDLDLVLELHGNFSTGKSLINILKKVDSNHVHINYDTGNALYWGNLTVEEMIEDFYNCIDYISYMHMKDKLGEINEWNFPALGSGYIPFTIILDKLKQAHNNATLSIEIEFTEKGVKDVNEVNKALKDSAEYLLSKGIVTI